MIRPLPGDVLRYGKPSEMWESMYDRPFQWGSKRTGPDLARVGGKYPNLWHYRHMRDPREITPKSIMPSYEWLLTDKTDFAILSRKFSVMKNLGVPYTDEEVANASALAHSEARLIVEDLKKNGAETDEDREIVALIAYLQRLGASSIEGAK
jgi:cytochrome c oxidase cbb3-type subunit I/II